MRIVWLVMTSMVVIGCGATTNNNGGGNGGKPDMTKPGGGGNPDLTGMMVDNGDMTMPGGDVDMTIPGGGNPDMACKGPSTLHPPKMGMPSIYCPFAPKGMNYCTAMSQHCCEPPMGAAACAASNTPCMPLEIDWQCEDPVADCPKGQQCCAAGSAALALKSDGPGCQTYATGKFSHTHCAASCAAGELTMCTNSNECTGGKVCQPFETHGNQVGACQ